MWKWVDRGQRAGIVQSRIRSRRRGQRRSFERLEHRAMLAGTVSGDFNGDGFDDLVAAAPRDTVSGKVSAGTVSVIYGSASGLRSTGNQLWTMNSPGVNGVAGASDFFGNALAVGDFNGDGFDDLAIGSPTRTVNGKIAAGAVNILFGSAAGLSASGDQQFTQNTAGILDAAEQFDAFGGALAAGDFDDDGFDDLAIGANGENDSAGAVAVIYGSDDGLTTAGDQLWTQDSPGINGHAEILESFGQTLAAGDFNGDGRCDLAVGTTADGVGSADFAGAVNVIYGSNSGLRASGDQLLNEGLDGVPGGVEAGERWGQSLAVGDFDRDGFDDLAAGSGRATVSGTANVGEFNVFYGSAAKLRTAGSQRFTPASFGIALSENLAFASTLAAGNFNGRDDLAIGIVGYDLSGKANVGAVQIAYGSATGLTAKLSANLFHEDTAGVAGAAHLDDAFAASLTTGDFDGDGRADLAVGIYKEDVSGMDDAGAVLAMYGTAAGIAPADSRAWRRGHDGILGSPATNAWFGFAVV